MFCPKCREEFRESFVFCEKCNVDLIETLPTIDNGENFDDLSLLEKLMQVELEKWLRNGGIAVVITNISVNIINLIYKIWQFNTIRNPDYNDLLLYIAGFAYSLVSGTMWGIFYISLGYIIKLLKGITNEKK